MADLTSFPVVPVKVECECSMPRTLPVWMVSDSLTQIRALLKGKLTADVPVQTYRCRHCKAVVTLTAGALHLV